MIYALAELVLPVVFGARRAGSGFGTGAGLLIAALAGRRRLPAARRLCSGGGSRAYKKQIRNGLPDALDLLIVCVEAGAASTRRS